MKFEELTEEQQRIVKKELKRQDIESEAEVDNNFNNQLAKLDIFKIDVLEMVQRLYEDID